MLLFGWSASRKSNQFGRQGVDERKDAGWQRYMTPRDAATVTAERIDKYIRSCSGIYRETSGEEKERKKLSCDIQARQELARNVYGSEKNRKGLLFTFSSSGEYALRLLIESNCAGEWTSAAWAAPSNAHNATFGIKDRSSLDTLQKANPHSLIMRKKKP